MAERTCGTCALVDTLDCVEGEGCPTGSYEGWRPKNPVGIWTAGSASGDGWGADVVRAILAKNGEGWELSIDLCEDGGQELFLLLHSTDCKVFSGRYHYLASPEEGTTVLDFVDSGRSASLMGKWLTGRDEGFWTFTLRDKE